MPDAHEHRFVEEQEPEGRLILAPCLICGLSAMDAMDQLREERSESGLIWQVRWLHFNDGASHEQVNAELARVAAGWEPFATIQNRMGGWALLVKKHA